MSFNIELKKRKRKKKKFEEQIKRDDTHCKRVLVFVAKKRTWHVKKER